MTIQPTRLNAVAWFAIALAFLPYAAKRAALLGQPPYLWWLGWDYAARLVMLAGVALAYRIGLVGPLPSRAPWMPAIGAFALAMVLELSLEQWLFPVLDAHLAYFQYSEEPRIPKLSLLLFDLFAGIWLVAASEELVFRRLVFSLLERRGFGTIAVLLISSAFFGLMHITRGLNVAVVAFLVGLIYGALFGTTRRLSLCIVVHYIIDFVGYAQFNMGGVVD